MEVLDEAHSPDANVPTVSVVGPDCEPQSENEDAENEDGGDDVSRAASGKRKKRGARKGKAAKAAAKALLQGIDTSKPAIPPNPKDEVIAGLAEASEHLAREISSANKPKDDFRVDLDEFPKIGELPPVEIKKSRWKQLISSTSGNPELQALARKVQEKEAQSNKSAPARMQQHRSTASVAPSLSYTSSTVSQTTSFNASPHTVVAPLEVESWRSTEDSRGRTAQMPPDEADHARHEVSPVPSLVSSRAASTYTPSIYSLATIQTRSSVSTGPAPPKGFPKSNVKMMTGIPWELDCLPRQARIDRNGNMPEGDIFSKPPVRKPKASKLAPIAEFTSSAPGFTPISKTPSITSQRSEKSQSSLFGSSNSPPTKLKMQMSSFGKMFGGLKKTTRD